MGGHRTGPGVHHHRVAPRGNTFFTLRTPLKLYCNVCGMTLVEKHWIAGWFCNFEGRMKIEILTVTFVYFNTSHFCVEIDQHG